MLGEANLLYSLGKTAIIHAGKNDDVHRFKDASLVQDSYI